MRKFAVILGFLLLSSCAYFTDLEKRVTALEQRRTTLIPSTEMAGSDARWRNGRTTEGTSNVDEITGMADGDWVIVIEENGAGSDVYFYVYDDSADCSPAADGLQRIDGTGSTDCWHRLDFHEYYPVVAKTDDYTMTIADSGTVFTNAGANPADVTSVDLTCPLCSSGSEGWSIIAYNMDTTYAFRIVPNAANSILGIDATEDAESDDGEYVQLEAVVGKALKVFCAKGDNGTYDIYTMGYVGTLTTED